MDESVCGILVSRIKWREDVLDELKCGSMES